MSTEERIAEQVPTGERLDPLIPDLQEAPLQLFDRWERQQWTLAEIDPAGDRSAWLGLRPFARRELREAMDGFLVGEAAVTDTLAPIVQAAPTIDERMFLTTQQVDEARHTLFFARYLAGVEGESRPRLNTATTSESLAGLLEVALGEATTRVRRAPEDLDSWYRAVVIYHLLIEGVLAVSGMRSLLAAVRGLDALPALEQGLTNVARDESRHIGFGVVALRRGSEAGHGQAIAAALGEFVPIAVRALVNPDHRYPRLTPPPVSAQLGTELTRLWSLAERALLGRVQRVGLVAEEVEAVGRAWRRGREEALAEYEGLHEAPHPAAASGVVEAGERG